MREICYSMVLFIFLNSTFLNAQQKNFIDQPYIEVTGETYAIMETALIRGQAEERNTTFVTRLAKHQSFLLLQYL